MIIWHLKQIGKMKKLGKWVPHELTEIQIIVVLMCHLLLFYATNNNEWFLDQIVTCGKKWIIYGHWQTPIQCLDWEEAPKYFPKPNPNLRQKWSWSLFGGLLPIRSTTAFWIAAELLCLRSMLSKSMRCKCKPQFSTEWAQFCTTMPDCRSQNHFKNGMNWAMKFCFICHIHLTSCQQTHFFKHLDKFLQGKCFHNQ